eukprot:CAMPEP_0201570816 /NCGR_PEP_ID=MMETSP0190_2-20130828/13230_1 /ASSEMBLY_ACC=CAM_ASM_000263 /TAXON_ID=37353 /ORGANISM="Rosalina sp." /LENGTH=349 /DNA_ID=CAMNT_0047994757 /DNA_START=1000 /DNA_END=2049 /DNA_ORIENTATION=-
MDIQFETVVGLIAAISSSNGIIRLMDIRTGNILRTFKSDTSSRDTKLFWSVDNGQNKPKFYNQLICLGFGKGSVRKLSVYDLTDTVTKYYNTNATIIVDEQKEDAKGDDNDAAKDDEKEKEENIEELENIGTKTFGVSNAIPVGYYDGNDNLLYVSSIGDRKIRVYEINSNDGKSGGVREMNASFQSKEDIMGITFGSKQSVNVKKVEMGKCYKLSKDGVIAPIMFFVPRKRTDFFQDDLYSDVLDQDNKSLDIDIKKEGKLNVDISYVSLKPDDMELLSQAPQEKETEYQKRRNSQVKLMEVEKLKQNKVTDEQWLTGMQASADAAGGVNRWDAVAIASEVADDEWSD